MVMDAMSRLDDHTLTERTRQDSVLAGQSTVTRGDSGQQSDPTLILWMAELEMVGSQLL